MKLLSATDPIRGAEQLQQRQGAKCEEGDGSLGDRRGLEEQEQEAPAHPSEEKVA